MSLNVILSVIIIIFILFELIEHLLFPIVWSIIVRNRTPLIGIESMAGKEVKVVKWQGKGGIVFINGELWKATSDAPLLPGDKAIIDKVDGLLLSVNPRNQD
ncbi:MAG: NfeD family protein [Deltaproteobacteria bacterium]|nr:NfeD family protein [Deltaproteobacteria bacterium]